MPNSGASLRARAGRLGEWIRAEHCGCHSFSHQQVDLFDTSSRTHIFQIERRLLSCTGFVGIFLKSGFVYAKVGIQKSPKFDPIKMLKIANPMVGI